MQRQDLGLAAAGVVVTTTVAVVLTSTPGRLVPDATGPVFPLAPQQRGSAAAAPSPVGRVPARPTSADAGQHAVPVANLVLRNASPEPGQTVAPVRAIGAASQSATVPSATFAGRSGAESVPPTTAAPRPGVRPSVGPAADSAVARPSGQPV